MAWFSSETRGLRRHAYAQSQTAAWFGSQESLRLQPLLGLRLRVGVSRVRVPDVVVAEMPIPEEEVFTSPPYLCVEFISPDDTVAAMQDRLDDHLQFGVPNVWVIDPFFSCNGKHRGWHVTADGWATAAGGVMRTADGRIAMPLADVLLP